MVIANKSKQIQTLMNFAEGFKQIVVCVDWTDQFRLFKCNTVLCLLVPFLYVDLVKYTCENRQVETLNQMQFLRNPTSVFLNADIIFRGLCQKRLFVINVLSQILRDNLGCDVGLLIGLLVHLVDLLN